jgi:hypothetical protein
MSRDVAGARGSAGVVLGLFIALAACADGPRYSRDGASDDQRRKDEAQCQAKVNEYMERERRIDADRETTLGATDQRTGRYQLPQQMSAREDSNRSNRLMDNCMSSLGWTARKSFPNL